MKRSVSLILCLLCFSFTVIEDPATIVQQWNTATNKQDIGMLIYLYDKEVLFYGSKLVKQDCISGKMSIFKKYPNLSQQITNLHTDTLENGDLKCSFDKAVDISGTVKSYPSYLVIHNGKIIVEGDHTTDANLEKKKWLAKGGVKCEVNGDGKPEFAYLELPKMNPNDDMDCLDGSCTAYIRFSNPAIPPIPVASCISGEPDNLGDLNGDGRDEIGILPGWFSSCWHEYLVFTFKDGKWINAVKPFPTHCQQWEDGVKPIVKDPKKPGYVIIHYSEFVNEEITLKTKSVPIQ